MILEGKVVQLVPIDRIKLGQNVRERLVEADQVALAESIKQNGILVPCIGYVDGPNVVPIAGYRRIDGAVRARKDAVPMYLLDHPPSATELVILQLIENCQRAGLKTMEQVRAMDRLITDGGCTAAQVSLTLGGRPSPPMICKLLSLLVLPRGIQDQIDAGRVPISSAYAIATVPDSAERDRLIAEVLNGRLTRDKLVAVIKARKSDNGRAQARKQSKPRRARVVVSLGDGCSVAVKPGVTLQTFIKWLHALLERFHGLEPQLDLAEAVKALAGKE